MEKLSVGDIFANLNLEGFEGNLFELNIAQKKIDLQKLTRPDKSQKRASVILWEKKTIILVTLR